MKIIPISKLFMPKVTKIKNRIAQRGFTSSKDIFMKNSDTPTPVKKVFNRKYKTIKKIFNKLNNSAVDTEDLSFGLFSVRCKKNGEVFSGIAKTVKKDEFGTRYEFFKIKNGKFGVDDFKTRAAFYFENGAIFPFKNLKFAHIFNSKSGNTIDLTKTNRVGKYISYTKGQDKNTYVTAIYVPKERYAGHIIKDVHTPKEMSEKNFDFKYYPYQSFSLF